jgi:hypothetical protein
VAIEDQLVLTGEKFESGGAFSVKENGEILAKVVSHPASSYDESVLRAVKKSSPLSAPPKVIEGFCRC